MNPSPFRSAWWLPGPHASTLWGKFGRKEPAPILRWETVETPDGDFLELAHLDTSPAMRGTDATARANDRAPRLFLMHGLEGKLDSNYVRGSMREARERGWNATLMMFRTCGPTPNRLTRSYHSGETSDPLFVINRLIEQQPLAPIGAIGVSLGGNVLCKLLGELGNNAPPQLQAAAAISAPFDLARASRYIGRGFGRVYERAFLESLVPKALEKIARHPELQSLKSIQHARTIWEFDDEFTSPVHGFKNAADYYSRSSSLQFLSSIKRSMLLLSAVDDPFLPPEVLDEVRDVTADNEFITLDFPKHGGHVGFVGGGVPWKPFYYAEWRATEFIAGNLRPLIVDGPAGRVVATDECLAPSDGPTNAEVDDIHNKVAL